MLPESDASFRFRYERARGCHMGDWSTAGAERSFIVQCYLLGSLFIVSILAFWGYAWHLDVPQMGYAAVPGLGFSLLGFFAGIRYRCWTLCSRIMTFGVWVVISLAALVDGQFTSPILWLLPMAPMLAGHMLCTRVWSVVTLLSCFTVLGLYVAGFDESQGAAMVTSDADLVVYRSLALGIYLFFTLSTSLSNQQEIRSLQDREEELERARAASESAGTAKSRFLANMSHEIRTPMHGIMGTTSILQGMDLAPQEREAADTIYNCGQSLLALLTNVLDHSKLGANKLVAGHQRFSPKAVVHRLSNRWTCAMQQRGIEFQIHSECPEGVELEGDAEMLCKVASYLLDNAIRYAEGAPVTLTVKCVVLGGMGSLSLVVQDKGPGIAPQEIERVVVPFERGRGLEGDNIEGIGLGLSLACALAQVMGGSLQLSGCEPQGLQACLKLELALAQTQRKLCPLEETMALHRDAPLLLVVDDSPVNLSIARAQLQARACVVHSAQGGKEAVEMAAARAYDLIFMDLEMPDLPGWKAARSIRQNPGENQATPIVALSAHDIGSVQHLLERGDMDGYLPKPFAQEQLIEILERYGCLTDSQEFAA